MSLREFFRFPDKTNMGALHYYLRITQRIVLGISLCAVLCIGAAPGEKCATYCVGKKCATRCSSQDHFSQCTGPDCVTYFPGKICTSKCSADECHTKCIPRNKGATVNAKRSPATTLKTKLTKPYNEMLTLGLNYVFPTLKFQFGITRHWAVAVTSLLLHSLSEADSSAKAYGINLGINYYQSSLFRGFWAELAPGINFFQQSQRAFNKNIVPSILATIGWRWGAPSGMNFGAGGGLNYIFYDDTTANSLNSSRLYPSIVLDFGYAF